MRITNDMIDPELRGAAFAGRMLMHPWRWWFRLMWRAAKRTHGQQAAGLVNEEVFIPRTGDTSSIRTRIYRPLESQGPLPVVLYLHGGGYFMGAPENFTPVIKQMIDTRPCVVVAPDYRKSFDAPYPAGLDDCYDALVWIKNNAASLGVRADQIMVGGHSAGGGLTAALTLLARDKGEVKIAYQMPVYPMIDDRQTSESARDNNAPLWNSATNKMGWELYLAGLTAKGEPIPAYAAPSRATDYAGLPPTVTFVGDLEPFRDETIAYVENLKKAGVPVEFKLFKGAFHGFDLLGAKSRIGKEAQAFFLSNFADAVDHRFAPQAP
jgi:acetyl esterase/lipase